jgi:hypothetical protein
MDDDIGFGACERPGERPGVQQIDAKVPVRVAVTVRDIDMMTKGIERPA